MIEINSGIICNIIVKAREISIADDLSLSTDHDSMSDTEWREAMAEYQKDDSYLELKSLINDLEPDQQQKCIALMYLGRGDFKETEWHEALEQALTIPVESRADYLIAKSMLADYLEEGLAMLGYSCEE
jgi:hypothetical protein